LDLLGGFFSDNVDNGVSTIVQFYIHGWGKVDKWDPINRLNSVTCFAPVCPNSGSGFPTSPCVTYENE
jgi:hypothetical protein